MTKACPTASASRLARFLCSCRSLCVCLTRIGFLVLSAARADRRVLGGPFIAARRPEKNRPRLRLSPSSRTTFRLYLLWWSICVGLAASLSPCGRTLEAADGCLVVPFCCRKRPPKES